MTVDFVRQVACNHSGYEALLLPLTFSPETPRSEVLFQQCLLALDAPRVRPQDPNAWSRMSTWWHCPQPAFNSRPVERCSVALLWQRLHNVDEIHSADICLQEVKAAMYGRNAVETVLELLLALDDDSEDMALALRYVSHRGVTVLGQAVAWGYDEAWDPLLAAARWVHQPTLLKAMDSLQAQAFGVLTLFSTRQLLC